MQDLEVLARKQRSESTPSKYRLRQIPPETGKFLALLAATAPNGKFLEIGTSGGYSALWLVLVCREMNRQLITIEIDEAKIRMAKETFRIAKVEDIVELIHGDARDHIDNIKDISFCFLDADKKSYAECYEKIVPNMVGGGLLVADNVISHKAILTPMVKMVLNDRRVDALVVPIGCGELVCRKI
jgi:caffeoyl-CoA O-methyltransferase